jgi:hypothetical protein
MQPRVLPYDVKGRGEAIVLIPGASPAGSRGSLTRSDSPAATGRFGSSPFTTSSDQPASPAIRATPPRPSGRLCG